MIGIHFTFQLGDGGCIGAGKEWWDPNKIEHTKSCKWTEEERSKLHDELVRYVSELLHKARVKKVEQLKDTPIEVTLKEWNGPVESWRILEEVL